MKTFIMSCIAMFAFMGSVFATNDSDRSVTFKQLPQKAQQFIQKHFKDIKISYAQQDTDLFDGNYEVIFTDGRKVKFRKNGEWQEVECKHSEVPTAIIPTAIKQFVAQKHATDKIKKIERDSRGYEVELTSGIDLKFNSKGKFIRYDD